MIGLTGLGAEIAKNLTLSGIKSLTLLDHRVARKESANFLVPEASIGKNVHSLLYIRNSSFSYSFILFVLGG